MKHVLVMWEFPINLKETASGIEKQVPDCFKATLKILPEGLLFLYELCGTFLSHSDCFMLYYLIGL